MKMVEAYKCELTGSIYESPREAARSEFRTMMRRVGGRLPAMGSVAPTSIMDWLAGHVESETYQGVIDDLKAALDYYQANRETMRATIRDA